jgi:xylulokinase
MRNNGMNPTVIRAGKTNMFLSDLFTQTFVNATGVPVELYNNDGSLGAALGAGIGAEIFSSPAEAFSNSTRVGYVEPTGTEEFEGIYQDWKADLDEHLSRLS